MAVSQTAAPPCTVIQTLFMLSSFDLVVDVLTLAAILGRTARGALIEKSVGAIGEVDV